MHKPQHKPWKLFNLFFVVVVDNLGLFLSVTFSRAN